MACLEREGVNLAAAIEEHGVLRKNSANSEFLATVCVLSKLVLVRA